MNYKKLLAENELEPICEFRYNECFVRNNSIDLHSHDFYELLFLEDNPQMHFVNGKSFKLPENTLIFIRLKDCHSFYMADGIKNNSRVHHLGFSVDMCDSLFEYLSPNFPSKKLLSEKYPPYTILNSVEKEQLLKMFYSLNKIPIEEKIAKNIAMKSLLAQIFINHFFNISNNEQLKKIPTWLSNTCFSMNNVSNFCEGLPKMIELSGKSKEHLCRSMKKYYGITASEFINELRLTYIANRLLNSTFSIIDICYESGFENLGWMYTLFKRKYGKSPNAFRKGEKFNL